MAIITDCDIYSPFGGAGPTTVDCEFTEDMVRGRGQSPLNTVCWTHYIDVDDAVTILDGCTRTATLNAINYADGDEVQIPSGGPARYVVVWVTERNDGFGTTIKRAYLMRHSI